MSFRPHPDHVYAFKSANARVVPPPERHISQLRTRPAYVVRFGATHAIALLMLEIGALRRLDSWDTEWYEGEVLRRLRARLFADPRFEAGIRDEEHRRTYEAHFDWLANTYQLDSIDLDAVLALGKQRYYAHLFAVLRSLYRDEQIPGEITAHVLHHYRFRWSSYE